MDDLNGLLRNLVRLVSFFVCLCLLAWAVFPEVRPVAAGLAVGAATSLINAFLLSNKVRKIADYALGRGRRTSVGFLTRAVVAVLVVMWAVRMKDISLPAIAAGFFFSPLASLVLGYLSIRNHRN